MTSSPAAQNRFRFESPGAAAVKALQGGREKALLLFYEREFLGCLNCGPIDNASVCNPLGQHGNPLMTNSIWNPLGKYGNQLLAHSPWNPLASKAPAIVDKDGNFYGYFSANALLRQRTTIPSSCGFSTP
jgi:hypothetical protein